MAIADILVIIGFCGSGFAWLNNQLQSIDRRFDGLEKDVLIIKTEFNHHTEEEAQQSINILRVMRELTQAIRDRKDG